MPNLLKLVSGPLPKEFFLNTAQNIDTITKNNPMTKKIFAGLTFLGAASGPLLTGAAQSIQGAQDTAFNGGLEIKQVAKKILSLAELNFMNKQGAVDLITLGAGITGYTTGALVASGVIYLKDKISPEFETLYPQVNENSKKEEQIMANTNGFIKSIANLAPGPLKKLTQGIYSIADGLEPERKQYNNKSIQIQPQYQNMEKPSIKQTNVDKLFLRKSDTKPIRI